VLFCFTGFLAAPCPHSTAMCYSEISLKTVIGSLSRNLAVVRKLELIILFRDAITHKKPQNLEVVYLEKAPK